MGIHGFLHKEKHNGGSLPAKVIFVPAPVGRVLLVYRNHDFEIADFGVRKAVPHHPKFPLGLSLANLAQQHGSVIIGAA